MSSELFRRARRAEAGAARVEDRRRLRLEFFRAVLAEGLDSLKAMHAEGASGEESVRTHARLIDGGGAEPDPARGGRRPAGWAGPAPLVVVALGGYGRGELHPSSDIDLMVVYDGEQTPFVQRVMQELLYALWDLGFQVGHSLRSLEDCVAMARTDFPSRTSMQEARLIAGDRPLFTRFRRVLRDNVYRQDFGEFLKMTLAERDQRYRKFGGSSPYIGEPNVKESAGALRDMHTAMWLGAAKFGARTLRELSDKGLITPREQAGADAALTFLWRVRNELHFFSGHKNDVLTRDLQPRIAKNLGYENDGDTLGVEQFMREYYLHARVIHRVSRRLIARCQESLSRRGSAERRERQQALADGLVFFDGRLHLVDRDAGALAERPGADHEGASATCTGWGASCRWGWSARWRIRSTRWTTASADRPSCAICSSTSAGRGAGWRRPCRRCTSWGCSAATCRSSARSPASCSTTSITSSRPTSTRCWPCSTWRRWRRASRRSRRAPRRSSARWSGPSS